MEAWISRLSDCLPSLRRRCPHEFLVRLYVGDFNCFRFANSRGTQNTSIDSVGLSIVVAEPVSGGGAKMATVTSSSFEPDGLMDRAVEALREAPTNEEFKGFCPPGRAYRAVQGYYPTTATLRSPAKAERLEALRASNEDLWWGGIWETETALRVLAGSNGLFLHDLTTEFTFEAKAELDERTVTVYRTGRDGSTLDVEAELAPAVARLRALPPRGDLPDGQYRVVFGPEAVSEIVFFTSLLGFGGRGHKQGRNYTVKHLGKNLFENARVVLRDDGADPRTLTRTFDDWGFPRQPLTLFDGGRVGRVAHDQFTAPTADENTGHGDGTPAAMLMELAPGDVAAEDLWAAEPGTLYVSRFHYPTVADPCKPLLKGSTKDGTYLATAEGLRDVGAVEFFVNPVQVLADVVALSKEQAVIPQGSLAMSLPGANIVPTIAVSGIRASGGTLYKE